MSKARKRSTKAGRRLAKEMRDMYQKATASGALRRRIVENFIGWAFAHEHPIPETRENLDAMICVFELFLREGTSEGWHEHYKRMNYGRQNGERLACQWWTVCKTLARELPMQHEATIAEDRRRREARRRQHHGTDITYPYPRV